MIYPRVYSPFSCLAHRGGFGSMQRLTKDFAPAQWVPADESQVGLFWDDGLLTPADMALFPGPKVVYFGGIYARSQAPPGSRPDKMNATAAALAEIADGLCHVSVAQRDFFLRFIAPGAAHKPHHIMPPIFDSAIFYPAPTVPEEPVIVATALWRDWFRWLSIFEGFAALLRREPSARLLVVGGYTDDRTEIRQWDVARELGIKERVSFRRVEGESFRDENKAIAEALREASVFVHARYADWGTLTGVEALACGLPVVCGDNGGLPGLMGESAITVPYRSPLDSPVLGILNAEELGEALHRAHQESAARRPGCIERAAQYEARTVLTNFVGWLGSFIPC